MAWQQFQNSISQQVKSPNKVEGMILLSSWIVVLSCTKAGTLELDRRNQIFGRNADYADDDNSTAQEHS